MARASFSTVEQFRSFGSSFRLTYMMGCSSPARTLDRTPPNPTSEASVCTIRGEAKSGVMSNGSAHKASRSVPKAWPAASDLVIRSGRAFRVRSFRGLASVANPGINHW